jgi:hypothetical protein
MKYGWLVVLCAGCASRALSIGGDVLDALPTDLSATGLYSDWPSHTVAPANRGYTPAFPLWSDGAEKSRWIYLPPATQIDVSDLDEWKFPVGTKVWKEFVLAGQRIETRMLYKRGDADWLLGTYVWSSDQSTATLASSAAPPPVPFPGTTSYEVPVLRCSQCHDGRNDKVLGFEAALLAAPEADQNGLTWSKLVSEGLVTSTAPLPDASSLQFLTKGTPTERQALGYLHSNCGVACHHATSGKTTPFFMRLEADAAGRLPITIADTQAFQTAVNVQSKFTPQGGNGTWYRIRPTDATRSTLYYRIDLRNGVQGGGEQMPPIASHEVDQAGVKLIDAWINSMTAPPYPSPAP